MIIVTLIDSLSVSGGLGIPPNFKAALNSRLVDWVVYCPTIHRLKPIVIVNLFVDEVIKIVDDVILSLVSHLLVSVFVCKRSLQLSASLKIMKKLRPSLGRVPKIIKKEPQVVPVVHPGSNPKAFSTFLAEAFSLICFVGGELLIKTMLSMIFLKAKHSFWCFAGAFHICQQWLLNKTRIRATPKLCTLARSNEKYTDLFTFTNSPLVL